MKVEEEVLMLCLGQGVERFITGCVKRSGAESGVEESSGSPKSLFVASSRSRVTARKRELGLVIWQECGRRRRRWWSQRWAGI